VAKHAHGRPEEERRRRRWLAAAIPLSMLLSSALVWQSSEAAFTDTDATGTNSWTTGSVTVDIAQTGVAVFNALTDLRPDDTLLALAPPGPAAVGPHGPFVASLTTNGGSRCITVTYSGTSTGDIRMYATIAGTLAPYLLFSVDTGSGATNVDCTGYTSSGSYIYGSANNTTAFLSGFPTAFDATAPSVATEWSNVTATTSKQYRLSWLLAKGVSELSQGKTSTAVFTWEAQNG